MKTRIALVFAALAASLTIPAVASANGGGGTPPPVCPQWSRTCGPVQPPYPPPYPTVLTADPIIAGSGNAEVHAVNVSCAAPNGTYSVVWVARITSLSPHNTPTVWSVDGQTASVNDPIIIVTGHTRQAVLFSTPPRIAAVATIGMSRPVLTASAGVPDYCT